MIPTRWPSSGLRDGRSGERNRAGLLAIPGRGEPGPIPASIHVGVIGLDELDRGRSQNLTLPRGTPKVLGNQARIRPDASQQG